MKIRTKVILLYICVLILSFTLSSLAFSVIYKKRVEEEVGHGARQTINAVQGNLELIFDNLSQISNLIYFDKNVQKSLANINSGNIESPIHNTIQKGLINMLVSGDYISSVFILDNYMNHYYSYKSGPILIDKDKVKSSNWYSKMKDAQGGLLYIHKSEDVLFFPTAQNKNYVSLIREIIDVDTYDPLAILLITIDEKALQKYFYKVGNEYNSKFCIIDSNDNYIVYPNDYDETMDSYILKGNLENDKYQILKEAKSVVVRKDLGVADWQLVGIIPMNGDVTLVGFYKTILILIITFNFLFVFICSLVLTKLIFTPLNKVQKHMRMVELGYMGKISVEETPYDEIDILKQVFNQMIDSINNLIKQVKQDEKRMAKYELEIIQSQINPHFLYNTLDAISALALINDQDNCLKMTQALGNFYRNSLNSGLELIKVKDEVESIESYITILNMRYDNKIILTCDIEQDIKNLYILKLILQPIVENAVYHGLRNKKGEGNINIHGYRDEDEIIFIVSDDGLGMSEDRVLEVVEGKIKNGKSGFGLYSSSQRISLYYNINDPIIITSELLSGTEIGIRVKIIDQEGHDEY